jgi:hypothetical protein
MIDETFGTVPGLIMSKTIDTPEGMQKYKDYVKNLVDKLGLKL